MASNIRLYRRLHLPELLTQRLYFWRSTREAMCRKRRPNAHVFAWETCNASLGDARTHSNRRSWVHATNTVCHQKNKKLANIHILHVCQSSLRPFIVALPQDNPTYRAQLSGNSGIVYCGVSLPLLIPACFKN